jgi:hypothetical protein
MKKIFLSAAIVVLSATCALAHPPSGISVSVSGTKKSTTVNVTADHRVSDPKTHYVKEITISADGKMLRSKKFDHQANADTQKVSWTMKPSELVPGKPLKVTATCNKYGSKTIETKPAR